MADAVAGSPLRLADLAQGPSKSVWSFDARLAQQILDLIAAGKASGVLTIPFHKGGPRGMVRFENRDLASVVDAADLMS